MNNINYASNGNVGFAKLIKVEKHKVCDNCGRIIYKYIYRLYKRRFKK